MRIEAGALLARPSGAHLGECRASQPVAIRWLKRFGTEGPFVQLSPQISFGLPPHKLLGKRNSIFSLIQGTP